MQCLLDRHFKNCGRNYSILRDCEFANSRQQLEMKTRELQAQGYRKRKKCLSCFKAAKYETQKPSTWRVNIVSSQVWVDVSRFSTCMIILSRNKTICCGLKKVVEKSRARVYSKQQILALLLVFHQAHNLSRSIAQQMCSCTGKSTNQRAAFLQRATNVFVAGQVDRAR